MKIWKKNYNSLFTMMATSGFGFNTTEFKIIVDGDNIWKDYLKKDKNAKGMREKSWPYFNDWGVIFGKDRANGEYAVDLEDMVGDAEVEAVMREANTMDGPMDFGEDDPASHSANMPSGQDVGVEPSVGTPSTSKKKKSKPVGNVAESVAKSLSDISKVFGDYVHDCRNQLDMIAHRVGYNHDVVDARRKVNAELEKINGLSMVDRHAALKIICSDPVNLDTFFSFPKYERPTWVGGLIWNTPRS